MKALSVTILILGLLAAVQPQAWTADITGTTNQASNGTVHFPVSWPPADPSQSLPSNTRPLLQGTLKVHSTSSTNEGWVLRLSITLTRSEEEADRAFWNSRLAFPEYDWMRYVRVWDAEERWLWPNLPYLLRLHGAERSERYGGVDPGKGVDNDFAAVLIRKYDASGQEESATTKRMPLVSAEWRSVGVTNPDKHTIVHAAQSDEFMLRLGQAGKAERGQAMVWLVFADFMGAKAPEGWPTTPEFAGGILAYFEVKWAREAGADEGAITLNQAKPKSGTGFDWKRWTTRTRAAPPGISAAKLSD